MPRFATRLSVCIVLTLSIARSSPAQNAPKLAASDRAEAVLRHIKTLASDEFEGRGPGTPGEEKTVAYLTEQFRSMGLKPGNPDGTFVQNVPLIGFQAASTSGEIRVGDRSIGLKTSADWVAVSRRFSEHVVVGNSDVVFVGYGVVAPEYGWDDYKGLDVRGKTVVMLVNDPPVPLADKPDELDPAFFKGKAMTYYGRWTYKYEIASEKGAAAALLIHETGPAGYPYSVVVGSWGRENFDIAPAPGEVSNRVAVESWISLEKAKELLSAAGQDLETLKKAAKTKSFRPVPLNAKARLEARSTLRRVESRNVLAKLEGADPKLKDEYVIYTAHWDHLGKDPKLSGDQIFNGAADNASGVAALLEIARGFTQSPAPRRSILFLTVTAEEKGLLGAKYYAEHPLYPLNRTLANVNMDVINLWGRTKDIISIGQGLTTLDDLLADSAATRGRTVSPDADPEKGYYYRSDHFEFAKQGVPALDPKGGADFIGKPADYGKRKRDEYTQNDYHKVSDEAKPDWDLSGAVEDLELLHEVGLRVANGSTFPEWKPGAEFKAKRDATLRGGAR